MDTVFTYRPALDTWQETPAADFRRLGGDGIERTFDTVEGVPPVVSRLLAVVLGKVGGEVRRSTPWLQAVHFGPLLCSPDAKGGKGRGQYVREDREAFVSLDSPNPLQTCWHEVFHGHQHETLTAEENALCNGFGVLALVALGDVLADIATEPTTRELAARAFALWAAGGVVPNVPADVLAVWQSVADGGRAVRADDELAA